MKIMHKTVLFVSLFICTFASPPSARAVELIDKVVAVVNEDVISFQDLSDRIAFAVKNIQRKLTEEQKHELMLTQLDELIDEELVLQHAKKRNYLVSQQQIDQTIKNIEESNKQKEGSFIEFAGAYKNTALRNITVTILRQEISNRELRPRVSINEDEVERILEGIVRQQANNDEKEIAQIFLPVTDEKNEVSTRKTIQRLHSQLLQKEDFAGIAKAYSRDSSATNGGYLGWFRIGELVPVIDNAIKHVKKGHISKPVRSANGWHIFKIIDIRVAPKADLSSVNELNLIQLYAPIDKTAGTPAAVQNKKYLKQFKKLAKKIDNKEDFQDMVAAQKKASPLYTASGSMDWIAVNSLDKKLQIALKNKKKDNVVGPIATDSGVYLFYVVDNRSKESATLTNLRQRISSRIEDRQVGLSLRSLLRDLRRKAFIDTRL